jgi:hypothetical protein
MRNNAFNEKVFVKNIFNNKLLNLLDKSQLPINAKIINSSPYIL